MTNSRLRQLRTAKPASRWLKRMRYSFHQQITTGTRALLALLALVALAVVLVASAIITLLHIIPEGGNPLSFPEGAWEALMRTLDPGTMGNDQGWAFRTVMLAVTLAGLCTVAALFSIFSNGLQERFTELRKGRSEVLERGHTIILNWSPSIIDVIREIAEANRSQLFPQSLRTALTSLFRPHPPQGLPLTRRTPRIVIVADRDNVLMQDDIHSRLSDNRFARRQVICRRGDPTDLADLRLTAPKHARAIVILSPEGKDPDAHVIKTVLALAHDPERRDRPVASAYNIVAAIQDRDNAEIVKTVGARAEPPSAAHPVLADDLIAQVMVHACLQPGLGEVFSTLLKFEGAEFYPTVHSALVGQSFRAALLAFENCIPIGLASPRGVFLNPALDHLIEEGDQLIVIAHDDSTIRLSAVAAKRSEALSETRPRPTVTADERSGERVLLLGWNHRAPLIVRDLGQYLPRGSELTIAADASTFDRVRARVAADAPMLSCDWRDVDTGNRDAIRAIDPLSFDHVLVLGYSDVMEAQSADTRTMVTLLHLRNLQDGAQARIKVVSEIIDVRNPELAEVTCADEYVVSNRLVSRMLAQVAENPVIADVFKELLDVKGPELRLNPVRDYGFGAGSKVTFAEVIDAAASRGDIAIGYSAPPPGFDEGQCTHQIILNPDQKTTFTCAAEAKIVVLTGH